MEASTEVRSYICPDWCSPDVHWDGGGDRVHGEVPEVAVVPHGQEPLTLSLERSDEVDDGAQVEHPVEYAVGVGSNVVRLSGRELDVYINRLLALRTRSGRYGLQPFSATGLMSRLD